MKRLLPFLALLALASACGGGGDSSPTPPQATTINPIVIVPSTLSIAQGSAGAFVAGTGRANQTGGIEITTEGAPAGMTIVGGAVQESPASSVRTFTVTVATSTAVGTHAITVRAHASGTTDVTTSYSITVTAVGGTGTYAISAAPQTFSVTQGSSANSTITLARTDFTGSVNLSVAGMPTGMTAAFAPNNTTGSSSTMTISAASTVPAGLYILTIGGVAAGQPDKISQISVTVTASGGFTLQASPALVSAAQGTVGSTTINITRLGGFAGAVSFFIGNLPSGVTASFTPSNTTANSVALNFTVAAGATPGTYSPLVTATATGATTVLLTVQITVTTSTGGGSGNVTFNFAQCPATNIPMWVAYQDGAGAWIRATGTGNVYSFDISSTRGGVAWVTPSSVSTTLTTVAYYSRTEMTSGPLVMCGTPNSKSVTGIVAGLTANTRATIALGGVATVQTSNAAFVLNGVADGVQDLVGYRQNTATEFSGDRVLLRRDVNIGNGGALGSIDLSGSESVAAATATISLSNTAGEAISRGMSYASGAACLAGSLYTSTQIDAVTSFTMAGVPAAQQRSTDYHRIFVTSIGTTQNRTVIETFHTLAARTIALPSLLTGVTVTSQSGAYKRLQTVFTLPSDYQSAGLSYYDANAAHYITIGATLGYLGSTAVSLTMPDFSAVAGWNNTWAPATSAATSWVTYANGSSNGAGGQCSEGARVIGAQLNGTN